MVQISRVLLISLLVGIPALGVPLNAPSGVAGRSTAVSTANQSTNIAETPLHPHHDAETITASHVLEARAPLFGFIKKIASSIFGRELSNNDAEEFIARANMDALVARASGFEDLEMRAPLFGFIKKIASSIFGRELTDDEFGAVLARVDANDLASRDLGVDDLEAREPLFGFIKKIASSIFGRDLSNSEVDEILS